MTIKEFVAQIPGFDALSHPEKIILFAWYMHVHEERERFDSALVRRCYDALDYAIPNVARDLARLVARNPPDLLIDDRGYRLHGLVRARLDSQHGETQAIAAISRVLADLPGRVSGLDDRVFLEEALRCLQAGAYRAAIVMTWNLAFSHAVRWVIADQTRLASFNGAISRRYPKKMGLAVASYDDFENLKESEIIEVLNTSGLVSGGMIKVMNKELARRNSAAHPSSLVVTRHQAEDSVSDLVNNVVLKL